MPDPPAFSCFGVVYKATNKINGKVYIGITTKTLKDRIAQHLSRSKSGGAFYFQQAIKKYGIESFDFETITECLTKEELEEKEIFYIFEYQAVNKEYGYNLTYGGEGVKRWTPEMKQKVSRSNKGKKRSPEVIKKMGERRKGKKASDETKRKISEGVQAHLLKYGPYHPTEEEKKRASLTHKGVKFSEERKLSMSKAAQKREPVGAAKPRKAVQQLDSSGGVLNEYVSGWEASRIIGVSQMCISDVCNGKRKTAKGFTWRFKDETAARSLEEEPITRESLRKAVIQLDKEGNMVGEFASISAAAKKYNLNDSSISSVCRGVRKSAAGFIWCYKNEVDRPTEPPKRKPRKVRKDRKAVLQLDKDGNIVAEFPSIYEAAHTCGLHSSAIFRVCKGEQETAAGEFMWCFKNEADRPLVEEQNSRIRKEKAVIQFDKEGNILNEFSSMSKAARACNLFISNIFAVCRGLKKTAGGFIWKYKEEAPKND
ncbi:MAG: NUMOD1 domain-containing DNA-binding protein [Candidatus Paceibacterota bacterium]|jgi:group I intron endonuclease